MLILTRHVGESFMIGNSVTITTLDVKGGQVRLDIAAPRKIAVHREEIYKRAMNLEDPANSRQETD